LPANGQPNHYSGHVEIFQKPGKYEIIYFVGETQTDDISPFKRSLVYKNRLGKNPPEAFH